MKLQRLSPQKVSRAVLSRIGGVAAKYKPILRVIKSGLKVRKISPYSVYVAYEVHGSEDIEAWSKEWRSRWEAVLDAVEDAGFLLVANPLSKNRVIGGSKAREIVTKTGVAGVVLPSSQSKRSSWDHVWVGIEHEPGQ